MHQETKYMNENCKIYNSKFTFKEDAPTEKRMADLFERKVTCKQKECTRYELISECVILHKLVYHRDQQFEDGHRSIEPGCKKENKKLKCRTLIQINI